MKEDLPIANHAEKMGLLVVSHGKTTLLQFERLTTVNSLVWPQPLARVSSFSPSSEPNSQNGLGMEFALTKGERSKCQP